MFGTMLPIITARAAINIPIKIIPVEIVVSVDVDVTAVPIAVTPPATDNPGANNDARPPGEPHSRIVAGVRIGVVRIIRRWTVDHFRVVRRHVDDLRIRWLDHDDLFPARGFLS